MRSLISAALLLGATADDETSLMQGLARHNKLVVSEKQDRKDATAKLMETATKMMKNGATPDVVTFIETTITELNQNVLGAIVDEHNRDQQLINDLLDRFDAAVAAMEECAASVEQQHTDRMAASNAHKMCRSGEAIDCARSRRCEEELEELWGIVKREEEEMRRIHNAIHGEWCVGPAPDHPGLADPFRWTITEYSEGAETSQSANPYPAVDLEPVVIEFRRFSVEYFGLYIVQKPKVEEAWENYNAKLLECAALEETWTLKVDDCDELQIAVHDQACMHAASNRQCASDFGHEYHMTMVAYNNAVATIQELEYDRKREWETLKIVTCLLETVYTHVLHSITDGEPCPTTETHPEQTEQEIQHCHVVEESLTANLTIDYGNPPPPPALPPVVEPPCTAQYIWDEHGSFPFEVQTSHSQTIADEGLEAYFTVLSAYGWAGCAAPRACIPCESADLIVDPAYTQNDVCKEHHEHLRPGQLDFDTFKCLSGAQCIRSDGRCNDVANCDDGSDELACETHWGIAAVLHNEECQDPFISDVQFRCADNTCTHIHGRCNGVNNCADGSDEMNCATTTHHLTLEATTGYTSSVETPAVGDDVFYDRLYTFHSLGSFAGQTFIKMSNEDKHLRHSHVQMKLRFDQPTTVFVAAIGELPWLEAEGWTLTTLEGPTYKGVRQTRHTDWSGELHEDEYGPGQVFEKTFPAGTVEMRGNGGGDGSFLIFVSNPASSPTPPGSGMGGLEGLWEDRAGRFYGGATIVLGDQCNVRSPQVGVWQTSSYRCDMDAGVWNFIETREAGGVQHHHAMVLQEDGTIRVTKPGYVWILHPVPHYHYGTSQGNTCPTSDVGEAECLAAVQGLLPKGQAQGRTSLVAGSWGWVPPGCSVQSQTNLPNARNGDWAAHYNRNPNGRNDGGYTPVCESSQPLYAMALADSKCPHNHEDRLFRNPGSGSTQITFEQCFAECANTAGCNAFSFGQWQGAYVCMGCTTLANAQTHVGFTAYNML